MAAATPRMALANTIALWVLASVAALFFLRSAGQLLIPIVIGVLISYALEPIVGWLEGRHVPRVVGTSVLLLSLLGLAGLGAYSLRDDVQQAIGAVPEIVRKFTEMMPAMLQPRDGGGAQNTGAGSMDVGGMVQQGVTSVFALAGHITVIIFLVFFLLLSGHHVRDRLVEIAGDGERRRTTAKILDDINAQIQRFLLVRLITAVVVGALTWIVLAWMGVQNAAVWGVLAGVFNSIPYFGPIIVSGGLLAVGLVQGGGLTQALQMSGAALVITSLEGWLLTPPLMGKAERMSALAVFLGLLLWTWVWGAWGTILAVPMLVVMKSVADHVGPLKPVGRLLAP